MDQREAGAGETPELTPEQREAIERALPCWCDAAYKDRGLTQPDCPRCNFANEVADAIREAVAAEREACAREVPTTWLDPLLAGDGAALQGSGPWGCPDVETLLRKIARRIRQRAEAANPASPPRSGSHP